MSCPKVIVSLTTYPARLGAVSIVLDAMLNQTVKPDRILLWLSEQDFPGARIPENLLPYTETGIDILFYADNLMAHKKYIYSMRQYPEDIIITVDDDTYYGADTIETLMFSYERFPYAVSAIRTHEITFDNCGCIEPYVKWKFCYGEHIGRPSMRLFATGVGGVLYPPGCLHPEVFNIDNLKKYSLLNDDIWLKVMAVLRNTPVVQACLPIEHINIPGTQNTSLYSRNVLDGKNDEQLKNMLTVYSVDEQSRSVIDTVKNGSASVTRQNRNNKPNAAVLCGFEANMQKAYMQNAVMLDSDYNITAYVLFDKSPVKSYYGSPVICTEKFIDSLRFFKPGAVISALPDDTPAAEPMKKIVSNLGVCKIIII